MVLDARLRPCRAESRLASLSRLERRELELPNNALAGSRFQDRCRAKGLPLLKPLTVGGY